MSVSIRPVLKPLGPGRALVKLSFTLPEDSEGKDSTELLPTSEGASDNMSAILESQRFLAVHCFPGLQFLSPGAEETRLRQRCDALLDPAGSERIEEAEPLGKLRH